MPPTVREVVTLSYRFVSLATPGSACEGRAARDVTGRRRLARQQAGRFGWPAAVRGFLHAHGLAAEGDVRGVAGAGAGPRGGPPW